MTCSRLAGFDLLIEGFDGSGLLSVGVLREGALAAPARRERRDTAGGCHGACAWVGMTPTDNKPLFRNRSAARVALLNKRARAMRSALTTSEALLWARLRGRRLGVVFRRQVPLLGRFIADFLAPAERLVVEIDGRYHGERARGDARRDAVLERAGYRVLRLDAELVVRDIEAAVARVCAALTR